MAAVYNVNTGTIAIDFLTQSTTDSSTMLIPVLSSRLGLSAANPRFTYQVTLFDFFGDLSDNLPDKASFNAWTPAITNGQFVTLAPNATVEVPVSAHPTEALVTRPKGYMIVTTDNKNGAKEAKLLRMEF